MNTFLSPTPGMMPAQASTLHQLAEHFDRLPSLSVEECREVWNGLARPGVVWSRANLAYNRRRNHTSGDDAREYLRGVAFLWKAGCRSKDNDIALAEETIHFLESFVFLFSAHQLLSPTNVQQLQPRGQRFELEEWMATCDIVPTARSRNQWRDLVMQVRVAMDECRGKAPHHSARIVLDHLKEFCLHPGDIGITANDLTGWLKEHYLAQAPRSSKLCTVAHDEVTLFHNVTTVLRALEFGLSYREVGTKKERLVVMRRRLEAWLSRARATPATYGIGLDRLVAFEEEVMPLFDRVL